MYGGVTELMCGRGNMLRMRMRGQITWVPQGYTIYTYIQYIYMYICGMYVALSQSRPDCKPCIASQ